MERNSNLPKNSSLLKLRIRLSKKRNILLQLLSHLSVINYFLIFYRYR